MSIFIKLKISIDSPPYFKVTSPSKMPYHHPTLSETSVASVASHLFRRLIGKKPESLIERPLVIRHEAQFFRFDWSKCQKNEGTEGSR